MEPWLGMALLWGLFAGAHIGLATGRARSALASRLGERGYGVFFSVIATCCYSLLISYYAQHRFEGSPGLALGGVAALRWALMGVIVVGVMLMVATFAGYARSPYADWQVKAWGAALILILLIGVLSLLSRWAVTRKFSAGRP